MILLRQYFQLDKLRRFAQNRHSVYIKFANFREWTSQSVGIKLLEFIVRRIFWPGRTMLCQYCEQSLGYHMNNSFDKRIFNAKADPELRKDITLMELARCRAETVVEQLEKVRRKMDTFSGYVRRAQPPIGDVVLLWVGLWMCVGWKMPNFVPESMRMKIMFELVQLVQKELCMFCNDYCNF